MTPIVRHFTATGFVIDGNRTLLHWHPKVMAWLPPGGHIEVNEDPIEAVLREVLEETGVVADVVPLKAPLCLAYPRELISPYTIMVEDIHDPDQGYHQHIDLIYFCRTLGNTSRVNTGWRWVTRNELAANIKLSTDGAEPTTAPDDVRVLASQAFNVVTGALAT